MTSRIFLSHKGANKPIVRLYYHALIAAGFHPWLDAEDMPPGTNPDRGIRQGFKDACAAVFFLTSDFKDATFLSDEINYAKEEERSKGDRFAVITVIVPDAGAKPTIPDLLRQYIWIEEPDHLSSLAKILEGLPIRHGRPRWKMEFDPDELDQSLRSIKGKILSPIGGSVVSTGPCEVCGEVSGYNQQPLYLFTGDAGLYWPSGRIKPSPEGNWRGSVNLGKLKSGGIIRLAAVDPNMAQYIEVYRKQANSMNHRGMEIPRFPELLHTIKVNVDPCIATPK